MELGEDGCDLKEIISCCKRGVSLLCKFAARISTFHLSQLMHASASIAASVWLLACHCAARMVHRVCQQSLSNGHISHDDLTDVADACETICSVRMDSHLPHAERSAVSRLRKPAQAALNHIEKSRDNNSAHLYAVPRFAPDGTVHVPPGAGQDASMWESSWTEWQTHSAKVFWAVCSQSDVPTIRELLQQLALLLQKAESTLPRLAELEQAWVQFHTTNGTATTEQGTDTNVKAVQPAAAAAAAGSGRHGGGATPPATPSSASGAASSPGSDAAMQQDSDAESSTVAPSRTNGRKSPSRLRRRSRAAAPAQAARGSKVTSPAKTSEAPSQPDVDDDSASGGALQSPPPLRKLTFAEAFGKRGGTKRQTREATDESSASASSGDDGSENESDKSASEAPPAQAVRAPSTALGAGKRRRARQVGAKTHDSDSDSGSDRRPVRRSSRVSSAPPSRPRRGGRRRAPRKAPRTQAQAEEAAATASDSGSSTEPDVLEAVQSAVAAQETAAANSSAEAGQDATPPSAAASSAPSKSPLTGGVASPVPPSTAQKAAAAAAQAQAAREASRSALRAADTPLTAAGVIAGGQALALKGDDELFAVFDRLELSAQQPGIALHRQRGPRSGDASRKAWSQEEVALLVEGLQDFGWGKWSAIDAAQGFRARGRNPADLRTKARQLAKSGKLQPGSIRNFPTGELP